jgi:hypothetical protein
MQLVYRYSECNALIANLYSKTVFDALKKNGGGRTVGRCRLNSS